jgi:hypothetical protein
LNVVFSLTLDPHDPPVVAARKAEIDLFAYYGLEAKDHYIAVPGHALKIRISEMGSGDPVLIVPGNTGDVFPLAALLAEIKGRRINRPAGKGPLADAAGQPGERYGRQTALADAVDDAPAAQ